MREAVKEYWNNVERATRSQDERIIDNFEKRRVLVEALTKYSFLNSKILELGSGAGLTAYAVGLLNGKIAYTGLDISETYAAVAKKHFGLNVVVTDLAVDPIPMEDGIADAIFAFDSMEHIEPEHRPFLFAEINRVLNKDSRFIFINNPLMESKHDQSHDFEFKEEDILALAKATNTRLLEVKILKTPTAVYQFIVLGTLKIEVVE